MERRFKRSGEASRRTDAALEEVRRLFQRYRAHPHPAVKHPAPRKADEPQRVAERATNVAP
jgi:hypothetical protein